MSESSVTLGTSISNFDKLSRGRSTRHLLEKIVRFRGKPRSIQISIIE